jgi:hypothetical protein
MGLVKEYNVTRYLSLKTIQRVTEKAEMPITDKVTELWQQVGLIEEGIVIDHYFWIVEDSHNR